MPAAQGPLPGGGILGDGHYCLDDVSLGGWDRCVQDGNSYTCTTCTLNSGAIFCPCDPGDGCVDPELSCAFGCDSSPCTNGNAALEYGYCFATGEQPENGGVTDWYFDAYCDAYEPGYVCNFDAGEGNVCVPPWDDDATSCVL